jgi:hypothetical protein
LALSLLFFVACAVALPNVFLAEPGVDDVTWVKRSLTRWWFPWPRIVDDGWAREAALHQQNHRWSNDYYREYYYAIDHPPVARIVYRCAFHAAGITSLPVEDWDYSIPVSDNLARGRVLPYRVRTAARLVNFAFFAGFLLLVYFGLNAIVANRLLSLCAVSALALEPTLTMSFFGIVAYIGADTIFLFCLALSWLAWLRVGSKGAVGPLVVGLAAGLAVSTKMNGSFVVAGAAAYYALYSSGRRRLLYPAISCVAALAVFLALNPVFLGGGFHWAWKVLHDVLVRRAFVKAEHMHANTLFLLTKSQVPFAFLPQLCLLVPVAGIISVWRRSWWFGPTAFWSLPFIIGNLAFLYMFLPKYAAPVRVAFWVFFAAAGLETIARLWRRAPAGGAVNPTVNPNPPAGVNKND